MKWIKTAVVTVLCTCMCFTVVLGGSTGNTVTTKEEVTTTKATSAKTTTEQTSAQTTMETAASEQTRSPLIQPRGGDDPYGVMPIYEDGQAELPKAYEGNGLGGFSCNGQDEVGRFCAIRYAVSASLSTKGIVDEGQLDEAKLAQRLTDRGKLEDEITHIADTVDQGGYLDQYLLTSYLGLEETNIQIHGMERIPMADRDAVKAGISAHGSAIIAYGYDEPKDGVISSGRTAPNREAVIIGWDDNKQIGDKVGAWHIYDTAFGDGYISYEDASLREHGLTINAGVKDYDTVYQFDGGYTSTKDVYFGHTGYMANQFISSGEQSLHEVGFFVNSNENLEYEVRIYLNSENRKNPTSGFWYNNEKKGQQIIGNTTRAGYYTARLMEPIMLAKDDQFAVVVILKSQDRNVYLPIDTDGSVIGSDDKVMLESQPISYATQSYVSMDGISWEDISAVGNSNVRIKAFTTNVNSPSGNGKLIAAIGIVAALVAGYFLYQYKRKHRG